MPQTADFKDHYIPVQTHGRYLLRTSTKNPQALLVGFHGYAEGADAMAAHLAAIDEHSQMRCLSIQGLHCFYRRSNDSVVASWMTRQHRTQAINNNIAYVHSVVQQHYHAKIPLFYIGFSQGAAMAYRAAAFGTHKPSGVIILGGDVPPELGTTSYVELPTVLIMRGAKDPWYTSEKLHADQALLTTHAVATKTYEFDGAHEWTTECYAEARDFIVTALSPTNRYVT